MDFKKGDKVRVFNSTDGKRFCEGDAVVDKKAEYGEMLYNICFCVGGEYCVRNLFDAKKLKG